MKFKVGDKVRCITQSLYEEFKVNLKEEFTIVEIVKNGLRLTKNGKLYKSSRFTWSKLSKLERLIYGVKDESK